MKREYCDLCGQEILSGLNDVRWPARIRIVIDVQEKVSTLFKARCSRPDRDDGSVADICENCLASGIMKHSPFIIYNRRNRKEEAKAAKKGGRR